MHIGSDSGGREPTAASTAAAEADTWMEVAAACSPQRLGRAWAELAPVESLVIPQVDPTRDLSRRADRWRYQFVAQDLPELCRFAAGLAATEAGAWRSADRSVATQAYAERRFLFADRIIAWAVPWCDAAGAGEERDTMLDLGDRLRPAPLLAAGEGASAPGEDGYGPLDFGGLAERLGSLWGGLVVMAGAAEDVLGSVGLHRRSAMQLLAKRLPATRELYQRGAREWRRLATRHPGSARLWEELAARAERTAQFAAMTS